MNARADLHHIQRAIILSLAQKSPLRFSELQPPRIPNNTFSYHLKKLVENGYIESTKEGYTPTRKALKLLALDSQHDSHRSAPVIITMLYVTNDNGEVLLLNKNKKPFKGWYGLPSGTVHFGETLEEAAYRELLEKTTLTPDDGAALVPSGSLDFQYIQEETDDIFFHAIAFIYKFHISVDPKDLHDIVTNYGQLSWSKLGRNYILPEVYEVHEITKSGTYQQKSVTFNEPSHSPILSLSLS